MSTVDDVQPFREAISRNVTFTGSPVGGTDDPTLEGVLRYTLDGTLHPGVLILHANPAAGGNMEMKLVLAIEETLASAGFATLRYNSRGVGNSTGNISRAEGKRLVGNESEPEVEDIGAALDFLAAQEGVDSGRLALVGHSFGSRISLAYVATRDDRRVRAITCIGLPVAWRDLSHLGQCPCPRLFVTGEHDDFSPPDKLAEYVATLPEPTNVVTLRNTGHFFEGREKDLARTVLAFLRQVLV
jgi:uncharacterized protein